MKLFQALDNYFFLLSESGSEDNNNKDKLVPITFTLNCGRRGSNYIPSLESLNIQLTTPNSCSRCRSVALYTRGEQYNKPCLGYIRSLLSGRSNSSYYNSKSRSK